MRGGASLFLQHRTQAKLQFGADLGDFHSRHDHELTAQHLARLVLNGERVVAEERLLAELDTRVRDVREGPDGALYVMTDRDGGKIVRLVPKKK